MTDNIELYLVSGFLGSGKTSFLKHALTGLPRTRVGVIVNEFGSIGVDGVVLQSGEIKMVEINNGSIFCACLKGGFTRTLAAFLEQDVDYLFVEASGLADPDSMDVYLTQVDKIMEKKPEVTRRYLYRGSICVADAVNFMDYADVFPVVMSQVQKSRLVLLNKIDEVSEEEKQEVYDILRRENPAAYIFPTTYSRISKEDLDAHLMAEDVVVDSLNTPWNRPAVYIAEVPVQTSIAGVTAFCRKLAPLTFRIKGFFSLENGIAHADCVAEDVAVSVLSEAGSKKINRKLVIIGRDANLKEETIMTLWHECAEGDLILRED